MYEIVNTVNGKTYIGCRKLSKDTSWRQYLGSGALIRRATEKYGVENFVKRFVCYAWCEQSLYEIEWEHIKHAQEISSLRGAYNVFAGPGAGGNTFAKLGDATMEEVRKRQSEGVQRYLRETAEERAAKVAESHRVIRDKYRDDVIASYKETRNMGATHREVGVSVKVVREILVESGVELNSQTSVGIKRPEHAEKLREYYRNNPLPRKPCTFCGNQVEDTSIQKGRFCSQECLDESRVEFKRKTESGERKKFNPPYDELFDLYIKKCYSIQQLMDHYGCKQRSIYSILKRNNLPTLNQRDEYRRKLGLV